MLSVRRASAKNTAADVPFSQTPLLGALRSGIISLAESDASETSTLPIFLVPERLSYSTPKHVGNAFGGAPRFQKAQRWGPAPRHWRQQRGSNRRSEPYQHLYKRPQALRGPVCWPLLANPPSLVNSHLSQDERRWASENCSTFTTFSKTHESLTESL